MSIPGIGITASNRKTKSEPTVKYRRFRNVGSRKNVFNFWKNVDMELIL